MSTADEPHRVHAELVFGFDLIANDLFEGIPEHGFALPMWTRALFGQKCVLRQLPPRATFHTHDPISALYVFGCNTRGRGQHKRVELVAISRNSGLSAE